MRLSPFMLVGTLLPLISCTTVGPDYQAPESFSELPWADAPSGSEAAVNSAWWKIFSDPLLESYLERSMRDNRNLQAAISRVERAHALRSSTQSDALPQVDAEAGYSRQRSSRSSSDSSNEKRDRTTYDAGLSASWEIDFFGGTRRATEAADARVDSAIEQRRTVQLAVIAEVARNYYAVRGVQKRIAITEANIELQSLTYRLVENLFNQGEASEFDLTRSRGLLQLNRSRLPGLDAEMRAGIYRLSVLLGSPPGTLLDEMTQVAPLPQLPDLVPIGQPSDLLRRRPDIRAAERELAASTADIGTATADFFPRFIIMGSVGRSGDTVNDLSSSRSTRYGFSPFIQWPLFQGGFVRAQVRAEKAEAQEAIARYEQTVLEALADAETSLINFLRKRETKALLQEALASRQRSLELARRLYNSGEEDFLSVLDSERELIITEDELVTTETDTVLGLITLYAAIGGGWEPFDGTAE